MPLRDCIKSAVKRNRKRRGRGPPALPTSPDGQPGLPQDQRKSRFETIPVLLDTDIGANGSPPFSKRPRLGARSMRKRRSGPRRQVTRRLPARWPSAGSGWRTRKRPTPSPCKPGRTKSPGRNHVDSCCRTRRQPARSASCRCPPCFCWCSAASWSSTSSPRRPRRFSIAFFFNDSANT